MSTLFLRLRPAVVAILAVLAASAPHLAAQGPSDRVHVGAGLGAGSLGVEGPGLAIHGGVTLVRGGGLLWGLRGAFVMESPVGAPSDPNGWDVGVLVGRATHRGRVTASVAAGVALVGNEFSDRSTSYTVGLPVQAEGLLLLSRFLALRGTVLASLNADRRFVGYSLGLSVGRLR